MFFQSLCSFILPAWDISLLAPCFNRTSGFKKVTPPGAMVSLVEWGLKNLSTRSRLPLQSNNAAAGTSADCTPGTSTVPYPTDIFLTPEPRSFFFLSFFPLTFTDSLAFPTREQAICRLLGHPPLALIEIFFLFSFLKKKRSFPREAARRKHERRKDFLFRFAGGLRHCSQFDAIRKFVTVDRYQGSTQITYE